MTLVHKWLWYTGGPGTQVALVHQRLWYTTDSGTHVAPVHKLHGYQTLTARLPMFDRVPPVPVSITNKTQNKFYGRFYYGICIITVEKWEPRWNVVYSEPLPAK